MTMSDQPSTPSPCTGVCKLAADTGFCLGCLRTGQEIGEWGGATDGRRLEILHRIEGRRNAGFRIVKPKKARVTG